MKKYNSKLAEIYEPKVEELYNMYVDRMKQLLKGKDIFFVVDHDDRYHWIRMRSRRDLQMIQIKADVLAKGDAALLEVRYAGHIHDSLQAETALSIVLQYYNPENTADGVPEQV